MSALTKDQAAIIGAYTGVLCGPFNHMHEYVEKLFGRPVFTHEMASYGFEEKLKELSRNDFLSLCHAEAKK